MRLNINLEKSSYDIVIKRNVIADSLEYIKSVYTNKNIYIVTDSNVEKLYLDTLVKALENYYDVQCVVFDAGEENKNIDTYQYICEELINKGVRRDTLLIGLGGGVVLDMCGFVSATLYRGLNYINIPTTLLSMVDSSIGGKTGIDFLNRKNVLGAFKQPLLVLIDPNTLSTLDRREYASGMAELIKHAIIGDEKLWNALKNKEELTEEMIYNSLCVKKNVVEQDELDMGQRMILNFGHTFGHVLELKYGYKHGEAVALGMLMAISYGIDLGYTNPIIYDELKSMLKLYCLPTNEYSYEDYINEIVNDKKNIAGIINFILISEIGKIKVVKLDENKI